MTLSSTLQRLQPRSPTAVASAVFAIGVALVGIVAVMLREVTAQSDRSRFESLIADVEGRITRQLESQISLLYGAAAFFDALPEGVTRESFGRSRGG